MKITAGFLLLVCVGTFTHPLVGSAQEEATDKAGQGEPTVQTQAAPTPTAPEEDYTAYIHTEPTAGQAAD